MNVIKTGVKTTEFWAVVIVAALKAIFPDIPDEAVKAILIYVIGRIALKIADRVKQ